MPPDDDKSLGDGATFTGGAKPPTASRDMSLGDERTLSGGDAAGLDTVLDDIEIVDLAARYKVERPLGEGGMGGGECGPKGEGGGMGGNQTQRLP